jgi:hypothetical protein
MTCKYEAIQKMAKKVKEQSKGQLSHEQARKFVIKQLERSKRRKEG